MSKVSNRLTIEDQAWSACRYRWFRQIEYISNAETYIAIPFFAMKIDSSFLYLIKISRRITVNTKLTHTICTKQVTDNGRVFALLDYSVVEFVFCHLQERHQETEACKCHNQSSKPFWNSMPVFVLVEDDIKHFNSIKQAPVVQKVDNAIHRINHYPLDSAIGFPNTYPWDSDLSVG